MNDNTIRTEGFSLMPPVVKNLLVINGLFYLATVLLKPKGIDLVSVFGLHYFSAPDFKVWQIITYMFMHGSFAHIFFNMFALWMFGAAIENSFGSKRFLTYYFVTGIGAAIIHYIIVYFQIHNVVALMNADLLNSFVIIGASGSVFGLLLAFGIMYPNSRIYIYFLIPIKAKWFVIFYGALELLYGIMGSQDGIAHFAHLGGMAFGLVLLLIWKRQSRYNNWRP